MIERILRMLTEDRAITPADISRQSGLSPALVAQAIRDLAAGGFLAPVEMPAVGGCSPGCVDCRLLDACQVRMWRPTEKALRVLAAPPAQESNAK
jgi:hypothetical protein